MLNPIIIDSDCNIQEYKQKLKSFHLLQNNKLKPLHLVIKHQDYLHKKEKNRISHHLKEREENNHQRFDTYKQENNHQERINQEFTNLRENDFQDDNNNERNVRVRFQTTLQENDERNFKVRFNKVINSKIID